jgi:hypothetical protein
LEFEYKISPLFILEIKILVTYNLAKKTILNIEFVLFDRTNILKEKVNMYI